MKTRKLVLVFLLIAFAGAAGWYGWRRYTTPTPPHISLEGVSKEKAKRVEKALEDVRRDPRSGHAWGVLGMTLIANGFYEQSIPCFAHAEQFDPKQPRWPYHQGTMLLLTGQREGFTKLRHALTLASSSDEKRAVLFVLARSLVEDGQLAEGEQYAGELRGLDGISPQADYILGVLAIARGDRATARAYLSKLTDHPSARKRVCALLAGLVDDNPQLARDYRQQARELPDDLPWPNAFELELSSYRVAPSQRLETYRELQAQGRQEEAVSVLRELVQESPDEASCSTLAFALFAQGRFEEAEQIFRQTIGFNPRNAKTQLFLGACLLQMGERQLQQPDGKEQAMELFRQAVQAEDKAIALQYDLPDAHLTRGRALMRLGHTAEAIESLRQAVRVGTEFAEMHQALGEALAETGQIREGLEHLENAVRLAKPNEPRPKEALEKWKNKATDKSKP